jgi:hypothetical protein
VDKGRQAQTYGIEIVSDVEPRDDLTRHPEILPKVTDITEHELLLDIMHSFKCMARKLKGRLKITRTFYYWCGCCGGYLGEHSVEYRSEKFEYDREVFSHSTATSYESRRYECKACGDMTQFHYSPTIYSIS